MNINKIKNPEVRISLLEYENLRYCFNRNLVDYILGKNYHNSGRDIATKDRYTIEDLKKKYDKLKQQNKIYLIIAIISFIVMEIIIFFHIH